MQLAIPQSPQDFAALRKHPVNAELLTVAIAGVVRHAQREGQTVEQVLAEILMEDGLLEAQQRQLLGEIISEAWNALPPSSSTTRQHQ